MFGNNKINPADLAETDFIVDGCGGENISYALGREDWASAAFVFKYFHKYQ